MSGNAGKCPSVFPEAKDNVFKLFCPNSSELKEIQFIVRKQRKKWGFAELHYRSCNQRIFGHFTWKKNLISSKNIIKICWWIFCQWNNRFISSYQSVIHLVKISDTERCLLIYRWAVRLFCSEHHCKWNIFGFWTGLSHCVIVAVVATAVVGEKDMSYRQDSHRKSLTSADNAEITWYVQSGSFKCPDLNTF